MTERHEDAVRVSDDEARRLLARAVALDGATRGDVSVAQLRQAALEAGVQPEAFEAALRKQPPWWVRTCMWGVPDRHAAKGFYWVFVAGLLVTGVGVLNVIPGFAIGPAAGLAATVFFGFASWSTSRAIQWLDKHGWDTLT